MKRTADCESLIDPKSPAGRDGVVEAALRTIVDKLDALLVGAGPAPRFLSVKSAAAYSDLSEDSIRRLLERGDLAAYRPVKGRILVDRQELERMILGSTTRPTTGRGRYERNKRS